MIISASYKTDIPAFYGPWLMNRLAAGWVSVKNPYGGSSFSVDLRPEAVDGFVFWTRNLGPFMDELDEIKRLGYPFVVHYTITAYPRHLQSKTIGEEDAIGHLRDLARRFGPLAGVWRYDPVLVTSLTPPDWHRATFARLAGLLAGVLDEVVLSFAQTYRKTIRNLDRAARDHGFSWRDPDDDEKRALLADLAELASRAGMRTTLCGQPDLITAPLSPARCIDGERLAGVAGRMIGAPGKAHRESCACWSSRDIGDYDSCPHGCVYCYAVNGRDGAKRRFGEHQPDGEFLIPPRSRAL